jgi:hypothetical protein
VADNDSPPRTSTSIVSSSGRPLEALNDDDLHALLKITHTLSWSDGLLRVAVIVIAGVISINDRTNAWLIEHADVLLVPWCLFLLSIDVYRKRRVRSLLRDTLSLNARDAQLLQQRAFSLSRAETKQVKKSPLEIGRVIVARAIAARDGPSR